MHGEMDVWINGRLASVRTLVQIQVLPRERSPWINEGMDRCMHTMDQSLSNSRKQCKNKQKDSSITHPLTGLAQFVLV
jgi:hypothetical protein